jgi:DNA-binding transcriptional regulator GbsR (MarR family)
VETGFIQNWAALARCFGMDPMLGRVHALAFLSAEAMSASAISAALDIDDDDALAYLESLERWGAVRLVEVDGENRFEADGDPWSWFMHTLRERGRREFAPLLKAIREANSSAQVVRRSLPPGARNELHRIDRIARFSEFVDQIAGLLETFASVGAGPLMGALRMVARMRGPKLG